MTTVEIYRQVTLIKKSVTWYFIQFQKGKKTEQDLKKSLNKLKQFLNEQENI
jgi:hypothetical protein